MYLKIYKKPSVIPQPFGVVYTRFSYLIVFVLFLAPIYIKLLEIKKHIAD